MAKNNKSDIIHINGYHFQYEIFQEDDIVEFTVVGSDKKMRVSMYEEILYHDGYYYFWPTVGETGEHFSWYYWLKKNWQRLIWMDMYRNHIVLDGDIYEYKITGENRTMTLTNTRTKEWYVWYDAWKEICTKYKNWEDLIVKTFDDMGFPEKECGSREKRVVNGHVKIDDIDYSFTTSEDNKTIIVTKQTTGETDTWTDDFDYIGNPDFYNSWKEFLESNIKCMKFSRSE